MGLCYEPAITGRVTAPQRIEAFVMRILIVEEQAELANLWQRHLERNGATVRHVPDAERATRALNSVGFDVLVVNLALPSGAALSVADYAAYRRPQAKVVFVTARSFFSDGSIFRHAANVAVMLPVDTPPADLAAVVEHYAGGTA